MPGDFRSNFIIGISLDNTKAFTDLKEQIAQLRAAAKKPIELGFSLPTKAEVQRMQKNLQKSVSAVEVPAAAGRGTGGAGVKLDQSALAGLAKLTTALEAFSKKGVELKAAKGANIKIDAKEIAEAVSKAVASALRHQGTAGGVGGADLPALPKGLRTITTRNSARFEKYVSELDAVADGHLRELLESHKAIAKKGSRAKTPASLKKYGEQFVQSSQNILDAVLKEQVQALEGATKGVGARARGGAQKKAQNITATADRIGTTALSSFDKAFKDAEKQLNNALADFAKRMGDKARVVVDDIVQRMNAVGDPAGSMSPSPGVVGSSNRERSLLAQARAAKGNSYFYDAPYTADAKPRGRRVNKAALAARQSAVPDYVQGQAYTSRQRTSDLSAARNVVQQAEEGQRRYKKYLADELRRFAGTNASTAIKQVIANPDRFSADEILEHLSTAAPKETASSASRRSRRQFAERTYFDITNPQIKLGENAREVQLNSEAEIRRYRDAAARRQLPIHKSILGNIQELLESSAPRPIVPISAAKEVEAAAARKLMLESTAYRGSFTRARTFTKSQAGSVLERNISGAYFTGARAAGRFEIELPEDHPEVQLGTQAAAELARLQAKKRLSTKDKDRLFQVQNEAAFADRRMWLPEGALAPEDLRALRRQQEAVEKLQAAQADEEALRQQAIARQERVKRFGSSDLILADFMRQSAKHMALSKKHAFPGDYLTAAGPRNPRPSMEGVEGADPLIVDSPLEEAERRRAWEERNAERIEQGKNPLPEPASFNAMLGAGKGKYSTANALGLDVEGLSIRGGKTFNDAYSSTTFDSFQMGRVADALERRHHLKQRVTRFDEQLGGTDLSDVTRAQLQGKKSAAETELAGLGAEDELPQGLARMVYGQSGDVLKVFAQIKKHKKLTEEGRGLYSELWERPELRYLLPGDPKNVKYSEITSRSKSLQEVNTGLGQQFDLQQLLLAERRAPEFSPYERRAQVGHLLGQGKVEEAQKEDRKLRRAMEKARSGGYRWIQYGEKEQDALQRVIGEKVMGESGLEYWRPGHTTFDMTTGRPIQEMPSAALSERVNALLSGGGEWHYGGFTGFREKLLRQQLEDTSPYSTGSMPGPYSRSISQPKKYRPKALLTAEGTIGERDALQKELEIVRARAARADQLRLKQQQYLGVTDEDFLIASRVPVDNIVGYRETSLGRLGVEKGAAGAGIPLDMSPARVELALKRVDKYNKSRAARIYNRDTNKSIELEDQVRTLNLKIPQLQDIEAKRGKASFTEGVPTETEFSKYVGYRGLSDAFREPHQDYINSNAQSAALEAAQAYAGEPARAKFIQDLAAHLGGQKARVYRAGNVAPGLLQSYTLDKSIADKFGKLQGTETHAYDVNLEDIAFPGQGGDRELIIAGSKVTRSTEGLKSRLKAKWDPILAAQLSAGSGNAELDAAAAQISARSSTGILPGTPAAAARESLLAAARVRMRARAGGGAGGGHVGSGGGLGGGGGSGGGGGGGGGGPTYNFGDMDPDKFRKMQEILAELGRVDLRPLIAQLAEINGEMKQLYTTANSNRQFSAFIGSTASSQLAKTQTIERFKRSEKDTEESNKRADYRAEASIKRARAVAALGGGGGRQYARILRGNLAAYGEEGFNIPFGEELGPLAGRFMRYQGQLDSTQLSYRLLQNRSKAGENVGPALGRSRSQMDALHGAMHDLTLSAYDVAPNRFPGIAKDVADYRRLEGETRLRENALGRYQQLHNVVRDPSATGKARREAGAQMRDMGLPFMDGTESLDVYSGPAAGRMAAAQREIANQIHNRREEMDKLGTAMRKDASLQFKAIADLEKHGTIVDRFAGKLKSLALYAGAGLVIYQVAGAISQAFSQSVNLEKEFTSIQGILGSHIGAGGRYTMQQDVFRTSLDYGLPVEQVAQTAKMFAQTGMGLSQTNQYTRATAAAQLGAGLDPQQAAEMLIAVRNMTGGTVSPTEILDRISRVESKYPVTASDLSTAVQRVGPLVTQLQPTPIGHTDALDLLMGAVTTQVGQTRVSGNQASTALKMIISRLVQPATMSKLQNLYDIKLAANPEGTELRPLVDIMGDIAGKYKSLPSGEGAQLLQTVSGSRQVNQGAAIFGNWDEVMKTAKDSASAWGDTQRRVALQMETLAFQVERVKSAFLIFMAALFDQTGLMSAAKGLAKGATWTLEHGAKAPQLVPALLGGLGMGGGMLAQYGAKQLTGAMASNTLATTLGRTNLAAAGRTLGGWAAAGGEGLLWGAIPLALWGTGYSIYEREQRRQEDLQVIPNLDSETLYKSNEWKDFVADADKNRTRPEALRGTLAEIANKAKGNLYSGNTKLPANLFTTNDRTRSAAKGTYTKVLADIVAQAAAALPEIGQITDPQERTTRVVDLYRRANTIGQALPAKQRIDALAKFNEMRDKAMAEADTNDLFGVTAKDFRSRIGERGATPVMGSALQSVFGDAWAGMVMGMPGGGKTTFIDNFTKALNDATNSTKTFGEVFDDQARKLLEFSPSERKMIDAATEGGTITDQRMITSRLGFAGFSPERIQAYQNRTQVVDYFQSQLGKIKAFSGLDSVGKGGTSGTSLIFGVLEEALSNQLKVVGGDKTQAGKAISSMLSFLDKPENRDASKLKIVQPEKFGATGTVRERIWDTLSSYFVQDASAREGGAALIKSGTYVNVPEERLAAAQGLVKGLAGAKTQLSTDIIRTALQSSDHQELSKELLKATGYKPGVGMENAQDETATPENLSKVLGLVIPELEGSDKKTDELEGQVKHYQEALKFAMSDQGLFNKLAPDTQKTLGDLANASGLKGFAAALAKSGLALKELEEIAGKTAKSFADLTLNEQLRVMAAEHGGRLNEIQARGSVELQQMRASLGVQAVGIFGSPLASSLQTSYSLPGLRKAEEGVAAATRDTALARWEAFYNTPEQRADTAAVRERRAILDQHAESMASIGIKYSTESQRLRGEQILAPAQLSSELAQQYAGTVSGPFAASAEKMKFLSTMPWLAASAGGLVSPAAVQAAQAAEGQRMGYVSRQLDYQYGSDRAMVAVGGGRADKYLFQQAYTQNPKDSETLRRQLELEVLGKQKQNSDQMYAGVTSGFRQNALSYENAKGTALGARIIKPALDTFSGKVTDSFISSLGSVFEEQFSKVFNQSFFLEADLIESAHVLGIQKGFASVYGIAGLGGAGGVLPPGVTSAGTLDDFGNLQPNQTGNSPLGSTTIPQGSKEGAVLKNLLATGGIMAGNLFGGWLGTKEGVNGGKNRGSEGAQLGSMLGLLASPLPGGAIWGPALGGLLGGLLGGRIGVKSNDFQALDRIDRNTRETVSAIENQTQMLTLSNRLLNVPTTFRIPSYSIGGGSGYSVAQAAATAAASQSGMPAININVNGAANPDATANAVAAALRNELRGQGSFRGLRP